MLRPKYKVYASTDAAMHSAPICPITFVPSATKLPVWLEVLEHMSDDTTKENK